MDWIEKTIFQDIPMDWIMKNYISGYSDGLDYKKLYFRIFRWIGLRKLPTLWIFSP